MAETICSQYQISVGTSGPSVTLLDFDKKMLAEVEFLDSRSTQPQAFLRSDFVKHFDRGNISNSITFSRIKEHASHLAAKDYLLTHKIYLDSLVTNGDAFITVKNGATYTLNNCVISAISNTYGREVHNSRPRTAFTYTLSGGKLTQNV